MPKLLRLTILLGILSLVPPVAAQEKRPGRLTINLFHPAGNCEAYLRESTCGERSHWRVGVRGREFADWNEFKAMLAKEADQQRDSASNISELRVMIRADRLVRYGYVHEIMDLCTAVGIYKIEVGAASPPRKQAPPAARNGPANEPPPAVTNGRDSHPSSLPGPAEGAHAPRELRIGIRPNADAAEWRVAGGVWRKTTDEWLQDVRASGAVEQTPVCLGPTPEVSWQAVVTVMDILNQEGFERIEFGSPAAVEEPAPASTEEVPDPHGPLDLRIVHRAQACAVREQGRLCDAAAHWSISSGIIDYRESAPLVAALRKEAGPDLGLAGLPMSGREVCIWADAGAPFGMVSEAMVAARIAGFGEIRLRGRRAERAAAPPSGAPIAWETDEAKAPLELRIVFRRRESAVEMQLADGAWVAGESEILDQLRSARAKPAHTSILLDPAADVPCVAVLRVKDLLAAAGFRDPDFMAPFFPFPDPASNAGVEEADVARAAGEIERAFREGDEPAFEQALDRGAVVRRALQGLTLSLNVRALLAPLCESFILPGVHPEKVAEHSPSLHFLRTRRVEGGPRALFRVLLPDRVDYLECEFCRDETGRTRVVDWFSLLAGERQSDTIRAMFTADLPALSVLNRMRAPTPGDLVICMGKAGKMTEWIQAGKPEEALEYFDRNAAELKANKPAQRVRLAAALRMGGGAFQKTMAAMQQDLADDPCVLLLRVSRTMAAQDRDGTVAAIDALDRWVQGDVFLDVLRAEIHLATKDPVTARACAERAVAAEPDLDRGWRVLVSACVTQRDFAAAVTRLTAAEAHGIRFGHLANDPGFAELVASPEYREWAGSRK